MALEGLLGKLETGENNIVITLLGCLLGSGKLARTEFLDALERLLNIRDNRIVLGLLEILGQLLDCLLYTSPSPRDRG